MKNKCVASILNQCTLCLCVIKSNCTKTKCNCDDGQKPVIDLVDYDQQDTKNYTHVKKNFSIYSVYFLKESKKNTWRYHYFTHLY